MLDHIETPADFEQLRKALGFNQAEMARRMGLSPRTYFSLEQDAKAINVRHTRLAELLALELAVERGDASLAPKRIARIAAAFAKLRGP